MAVSGSFDFTLTRDTCIKEALQQLGVIGEGETPSSTTYTDCAVTMNLMLKSWQNKEVAKNLIRKFYVFLNDEQREYDLSTTVGSSAPSCFDFYADTTAADYTDGDTSLTVTTGTGATDADEIIIMPDSGAWDGSVGDVESGGGTTTLTIPDMNVTAESGKYYYTWSARVTRPVDIIYVNRCMLPTSIGEDKVLEYISTPCKILNQRDYASLAAKDTDGAATNVYYDPQWPTAQLYVWPEPSAIGEFLEIWGQFTIDDMDEASNNFALPSHWYYAVTMNLAKALLSKFGCSAETRKHIKEEAQNSLLEAEMGETEDYLQFQPDLRGRR